MGSVVTSDEPFGFLLVTSDPLVTGDRRGSAFQLVQARLDAKRWPLYERTRNRDRMNKGARVAFYIAGTRENGGCVVATASVSSARKLGNRPEVVDPPKYLTDAPSIILDLEHVELLGEPISFHSRLPQLSFCPQDLKKWGNFLQGGTRALSKEDWNALLAPSEQS